MAPALTERNWSVLGLLRFILAFTVMSFHTVNSVGIHKWLMVTSGFAPVCGFFAISGFSIAASIAARPHGFFKRRVLRIYPMTIVCIVLTLALVMALGPGVTALGIEVSLPSIRSILMSVLLLNGLVVATPYIVHMLWSLNCEVLYYVAAPLLRRMKSEIILIIAMASLYLYAKPLDQNFVPFNPGLTNGYSAASLFWIWALGFLLYRHRNDRKISWLICIAACVLISPYTIRHVGQLGLPLFLVTIVTVGNLAHITLPHRWVRAANYLGEISFPLYLTHFPVLLFGGRLFYGLPTAAIIALCWVLSLLLAVVFYHGIDHHFRIPRRIAIASAQDDARFAKNQL